MDDWLSRQGLFFLALIPLLLLFGLFVVLGLNQWDEPWQRILLIAASLVSYSGFALAIYHLVQTQQQTFLSTFEQAQEAVLDLTEDLRRNSDQLTTERDRAEFLRHSFADLARSLEPRRVFREILQRAVQATKADRGSILFLDAQGQPNQILLDRSSNPERVGPRTREILNQGLTGWVVRNRTGAVIHDTEQDQRWLNFPGDQKPVRSAVAVPFLRRGRVLGVIVLVQSLPFQFTEGHLNLLQELAGQAAVALENADLYTMAESERRKLAAILRGATDVVVVVDVEGLVLLLNPAAERAFGLSAGRVMGRPLSEVVAHQDLVDLFSQAMERQEAVSGELSTGDERVRYGTVSPIPNIGWMAILQDITYLKELDRMKSEFVSTVSHDLRSPLTTVRGFADMVAMLGPVTPGQQDAVAKIRRAVAQMNDLIGDLLDLGKIEAGLDLEMSPCQIDELAEDVLDALLPRAQLKGHDLQLGSDGPLPPILGNAGRLRQIMSNLLDNAIKYTPDGGVIRLRLARQDQRVLVAVSDDGVGIAPQDQEQLFQKFYRVQTPETQDIPGTGLGLALVRSIVEQHGGRIWVNSSPGEGSTFIFSLPLMKEK